MTRAQLLYFSREQRRYEEAAEPCKQLKVEVAELSYVKDVGALLAKAEW
ncbi:MAG: hypothetical protein QW677_05505 [Pyrobaculum sp.]|uniref:Uncharacterized protein n=1 Tax=Pyrobaculum arsenaticum TaxID=121277 RepID=A0A7L4PCH2_9CREN|nr:hypothetical protein [Pyrobaculum arsenaticum]MCY0889962.1 hypothetical protein [Pyrobaculum arsenaticum]NYR16383.1 hypothetical protein [Pyrobaculum arsenaticum]